MGLGLAAVDRTKFFDKYGAILKKPNIKALDIRVVIVDVSATCRSAMAQIKAQTKSSEMTARRVACGLYEKMTRCHPMATEFAWVFDSYTDLHPLRHKMYAESRYRKATPAQLRKADMSEKVLVNGRLYHSSVQPYADDECAGWTLKTPLHADRVFNSSAAKRKFYELLTEELVCLSAEHTGERVTYIDTMKSWEDRSAVIVIRCKPNGVEISTQPRGVKHGEADQKICCFFGNQPDKGASGVWHTCDCDSVGQSVCNHLNCRIVLSGMQVVEPFKLPQGPACALALLCDGGDYNSSIKYAQISSVNLFSTLESRACPKFLTVSPDGIELDYGAFVEFLTQFQPERRKRNVYVVAGDPPEKFYRTKGGAEGASKGKPVEKKLPNGSMLMDSLGDLLRAVVYWMMGCTENSSDFGLLESLYVELGRTLIDNAQPTNVENLRELVDADTKRIAISF